MTELGQKLKQAREAKGLSLEQLQEITKIQKRYLAAVEEGNYGVLPGEFYVKAFIKQYAESVGISKEELAALQSQSQPQVQENVKEVMEEKAVKKEKKEKQEQKEKKEEKEKPITPSRKQKVAPSPTSSTSGIGEHLPRILAIVVIVGVLLAGWFVATRVFSNNTNDTDAQQESTNNNTTVDGSEDSLLNNDNATNENTASEDTKEEDATTEDTKKEEAAKQELTVTETSGNRSTMTLKNADSFAITLTATENGASYVRIRNSNDEVLYEGTLQNGQTETVGVSSGDTVELNIGHSPSLHIAINDEEMTYPIDPSERDHQFITIEHITETEETS